MNGILVAAAVAAQIIGGAAAVDGDTLDVNGERVRLAGIDAPEAQQPCYRDGNVWPCGSAAEKALVTLIEGRKVHCAPQNKDQYGRWIATCYTRVDGRSVNINAWLVRSGWAMDWKRYSDGRYRGAQQAAAQHNRGIWAGRFEKPWLWRWAH